MTDAAQTVPFPTADSARPDVPDVLANRYASRDMLAIWSPAGKVVLERELWIAVMKAQASLGIAIPPKAIADYERVKDQVDLASIEARERTLRHDVKARIDEFCALAGHEHIHKGMTSRDLTDNVEQLQMRRALELLREKTAAALLKLAPLAAAHRDTPLVARTHHVPAQATTLGKRFSMWGEPLLRGFSRLDQLLADYPLRGLKGAVGTRLDQTTLLGGDTAQAEALEQRIAQELGFERLLDNVGQVYPRSLDFEALSAMFLVTSALSDLATGVRLMTGSELLSEGFGKQQVGSSAMPHKMNARNSERINGFHAVLAGFQEMTARLSGGQWNEGDVSCSVVRRVALPGACYALDGALETALTVLGEMEIYEASISAELRRVLPFLATTTLMMEAVKAGGGRETLHELIRQHSVAVIRDLREGRLAENDLPERLGGDADFPLDTAAVRAVLSDPTRFLGAAPQQVDAFVAQVAPLRTRFPQAEGYAPDGVI